MNIPPFGHGASEGFELNVVQGPFFDFRNTPLGLSDCIRTSKLIANSAIRAVARARAVSYVERRIEPSTSLKNTQLDNRDEYAIHFIVVRRNRIYGAIRLTFHRDLQTQPKPLFGEILDRQHDLATDAAKILESLSETVGGFERFAEVTSWFMNPDVPNNRFLGVYLPCVVWAYTSMFSSPFPGIASLRSSNAAASVMRKMGGRNIDGLAFHDPKYQGGVELMTLHSHRFSDFLAPHVTQFQDLLTKVGVTRPVQF